MTQKATGDGDADDDGDDDDEDDDGDGMKQKNDQIPNHTACQKRFLSIWRASHPRPPVIARGPRPPTRFFAGGVVPHLPAGGGHPTRREQGVSNQVRDSEGELQFKLFQKAMPSKIVIESTRFPPFRTRYHGDKL